VVDRLVSNLDLFPTLCAALDLGPCEGPGSDLFARAGDGDADDETDPGVVIENSDAYPEKFHGLRTARWKLLLRESDGRVELYDLRQDPGETRNRAADEEPLAARLRALFEKRLHALRAVAFEAGEDDATEDPEVLERMRKLGYTR